MLICISVLLLCKCQIPTLCRCAMFLIKSYLFSLRVVSSSLFSLDFHYLQTSQETTLIHCLRNVHSSFSPMKFWSLEPISNLNYDDSVLTINLHWKLCSECMYLITLHRLCMQMRILHPYVYCILHYIDDRLHHIHNVCKCLYYMHM